MTVAVLESKWTEASRVCLYWPSLVLDSHVHVRRCDVHVHVRGGSADLCQCAAYPQAHG
jgi:hypothetical protein